MQYFILYNGVIINSFFTYRRLNFTFLVHTVCSVLGSIQLSSVWEKGGGKDEEEGVGVGCGDHDAWRGGLCGGAVGGGRDVGGGVGAWVMVCPGLHGHRCIICMLTSHTQLWTI